MESLCTRGLLDKVLAFVALTGRREDGKTERRKDERRKTGRRTVGPVMPLEVEETLSGIGRDIIDDS